MIILPQDKEPVISLEERFRMEIYPTYENLTDALAMIGTEPDGYHIRLDQRDKSDVLGHYKTLDEAKRVIEEFTEAYDSGIKVFRVK